MFSLTICFLLLFYWLAISSEPVFFSNSFDLDLFFLEALKESFYIQKPAYVISFYLTLYLTIQEAIVKESWSLEKYIDETKENK